MTFGRRLKRLRKHRRLTQARLAKILGVSRSSECAYEAGTREPGHETLLRISNYFGCSIDYLLTGKVIVRRRVINGPRE